MSSCINNTQAQSTVEAAFILPLLLLVFLCMLEPAIVLLDSIALNTASSEAERLLLTKPDSLGQELIENLIERRLSFLPDEDHICVLQDGHRARVELHGGDSSSDSVVKLEMRIRPLPLIDALLKAFRGTEPDGCIVLHSEFSSPTQPQWIQSGVGSSPRTWEEVFEHGSSSKK